MLSSVSRLLAAALVPAAVLAADQYPANFGDMSIKLELLRSLTGGTAATPYETVYINSSSLVGSGGADGTTYAVDCAEGGEAARRIAEDTDIEFSNRQSSSLYFKFDDDKGGALAIEARERENCLLLGTPDYEAINAKCRTTFPEDFVKQVEAKVAEIYECANEGGSGGDSFAGKMGVPKTMMSVGFLALAAATLW
ncbi:unnamed protein product [Parascedosporium putredinis]|uniref:Uncharacterized protein n=1 Tax=Parascedosporium putredinis TaxID=1442378 RepID=A0A9P1H1H4_9PEZI|nr:unnamed protein product [Parascedosporium putredinis]CAI7993636.1 unnamed protein product [Parascedosporium putredinis]